MKNKILLISGILILTAYFAYNYMYQEHRNVQFERAIYSLESDSLHQQFYLNQEQANTLYLNQIIELNGVVTNISTNLFILKPGVVCQTDSTQNIYNLKVGDTLSIKGRCLGYDDLFEEVKMDKISYN